MKWRRLARLLLTAWGGIKEHRLRAGLAAGGLLVGVAAVVVMVAVGNGTRNQVLERITSLGANVIYIRSAKRAPSGLRTRSTTELASLDPADAEALSRLNGAVAAVPMETRLMRMSGPTGAADALLVAAPPEIFPLENQALAEGEFFSERDNRSSRRVAVVGPALRQHLAGDGRLVGRTIEIKKQPFLVKGELMPKGVNANGTDLDTRAYIPLKTGQRRLMGGLTQVGMILLWAEDQNAMQPLATAAAQLLRRRHGLKPGQPDDFRIRTQLETIQRREESNRIFSSTITGVAAVSLLVAGVGIMAVMLIAVKERTTEIGLRRAVGARRRDILMQFMAEALVLGLAGGGGGALLGLFASWAVRAWGPLEFVLPWHAALGAAGLALAISLGFGLAPAQRAARLTPVDALRE